jgi:hypothetical protein
MPEEAPFFPAINLEKVRMLGDLVLGSTAQDYKSGLIRPDRVRESLNYALRALSDEEGVRQLAELTELTSPEFAVKFLMSRLGNVQRRNQDPRFEERTGRLIGMVEALPRTHRDRMPARFWSLADPVLASVKGVLRVPIRDLAVCAHAVWMAYRGKFRDVLRRFPSPGAGSGPPDARLMEFLAEHEEWMRGLVLSVEEGDPFDRFLALFSRTTLELRGMRALAQHRQGSVARRLSPLERFPVVRLGSREVVVPNIRYLGRNFTDIIHFSLTDIDGYFDVRGGLQELYLRSLVEDRLPAVTLIPETTYRRKKGEEVKGADLTVVEGDRLILVESKAGRILAGTRLNATPEALIGDLGDAIGAVRKAPRKVADLYAGWPEFAQHQEAIDRTRGRPPLIVAVMGDEIEMMGELVAQLPEYFPEMPSPADIGPYSIMGIDSFERAVEVASQGGEPLSAVLDSYIADAATGGPGARRLDVPGDDFEPVDSFAVSFLRAAVES